jgi:1,4-dihydroxy-2-naphthoate polyprenyltransferase
MKHWIEAARLRTLPLSVSGIIVGSIYALANPTNEVLTPTAVFKWTVFALAILTTLGLQILSNFANDYGDGVKGTDNSDRIGPKRAIQSGKISAAAMKRAIVITATLTLFVAVLLIYKAFSTKYLGYSIFFLGLGVIAIASAVKYTVGRNAYGYHGLGDLFVFVFFGWVSTLGVHFLHTQQFASLLVLPATAIGLLSVAVLNLNNMRDEHSDRKANKNTLVVKMGGKNAKYYHAFLIITAMILVVIFAVLSHFSLEQYLFMIVFIPLFFHLKKVFAIQNNNDYDPELKKVALSTFAISALLALNMIYFFSDLFVNIFMGGR